MRKLFLMAAVCGLLFASCGNKQAATEAEATQDSCKMEKTCCHKMCEEQKAECEAWHNFDSLSQEEQEALLNKKKECYDKMRAECEAKEKEMVEKRDAIDAKMANWDKMTNAEKKALFDEIHEMCPKHQCHKGEGKTCCHEGQPCCDKKPCDGEHHCDKH